MLLNRILSTIALSVGIANGGFNYAMPDKNISGTLFLVNKDYKISDAYYPNVVEANVKGEIREMRPDAAKALEIMFDDAKAEGINLRSFSGTRSYSRQKTIYHKKIDSHNGSVKKAEEYVAPPGASEHQLGLAMDVKTPAGDNLGPAFGKTKQGIWIQENCYKYGFIVRYSKEYEKVTKYNYEPWHLRYVGVEAAYAINKLDNIPLEWFVSDLRLKTYQSLITE